MCDMVDFGNVSMGWYFLAGVALLGALEACLVLRHPEQLRPKDFFGIKIWSNLPFFDPRRCGYCAIVAWMPVVLGASIMVFQAWYW